MLLIVGLGNPGARHARNRHNVGFMAVDAIAGAGFGPFRPRFHGLIAEGKLGKRKAFLFKPSTFMNRSGEAVGAAQRFYKVPLHDIVVLHDEIDLKPGKVRVKLGGGSAGHQGLASLDAHIGPDYRRVRIGVGHPGSKDEVEAWVLSDFAPEDRAWLEAVLGALKEAVDLLASGDDPGFMSKVAWLIRKALGLEEERPV
jgi:PTH1 family peptidyl-tRNA hydrolase